MKILDFGLARQIEPSTAPQTETSDGRTVLGKTEPGMVMGTIGYMSPGARVVYGFGTWHLVDAKTPSTVLATAEPAISPTERFLPSSWSPTGDRIAGQVVTIDGVVSAVGVYTVATKRFARVPGTVARGSYWLWPVWLADGRRLILRRPDGVGVVDADTGEGRMLFDVGGIMVGRSVGVSRDNRWITYTETATEGDVWIATIR